MIPTYPAMTKAPEPLKGSGAQRNKLGSPDLMIFFTNTM